MGSLIICFTTAYIIYYYLNYGNKWATSNSNQLAPLKITPQAKALQYELVKLGIRAKLEKLTRYEHIIISIPESEITIEIDGTSSKTNNKSLLADLRRTHYSLVNGHYTIRIPNSLIKNNLTQAVNYINRIITCKQEDTKQIIAYPFEYSLQLKKAS